MLMGKQEFQWGNNENKAGKLSKLKFSGETSFLGGSSFNLSRAMFLQGRFWRVCRQLACGFVILITGFEPT